MRRLRAEICAEACEKTCLRTRDRERRKTRERAEPRSGPIFTNPPVVGIIYIEKKCVRRRLMHDFDSPARLRFVALIAMCAVALGAASLVGGCDRDNDARAETELLVLGDSIAEALLGPSPMIYRSEYAYNNVLGRINGFTYRNRAVSGHQTGQMLEYLNKDEDSAYLHLTRIKEADVIFLSILGNDLLQNHFPEYIEDAMQEPAEYGRLNARLDESRANFEKIIERIRELNANGKLFVQTVYNPMYPHSRILSDEVREDLKAKFPAKADEYAYYELSKTLVDKLNDIPRKYCEEHPDKYEILDVNREFDRLAKKDGDRDMLRLKRLMNRDGVHPSNYGHATIVALAQAELERLGIADREYALKNYKKLRCGHLDDFYGRKGSKVNAKKLKKRIRKAKSIEEINEIYFDGTDGCEARVVKPVFKNKGRSAKRFLDEERTYRLREMHMFREGQPIVGVLHSSFLWEKGALDLKRTYVRMTPDGRLELRLTLKKEAIKVINAVIGGMGKPDELLADPAEIKGFMKYIDAMFYPESLDDIDKMIKRLESDIDLTVEGLDFSVQPLKHLAETIGNGEIYGDVRLPDDVAFVLNIEYELREVRSAIDGKKYEAVFLGNSDMRTDPYVMLTLEDAQEPVLDADGNDTGATKTVKHLKILNELLPLYVDTAMEERQA